MNFLIKKLMKKKNISRKQLSQDLNIKYTTICEWIKGTMMPRSEALSSLAEYFGITISELLADEETTSSFIKAPLLVVLNEETFEDISKLYDELFDKLYDELMK